MSSPHAIIENSLLAALHLTDEEGESLVVEVSSVSLVFVETGIPGPAGPGAGRYTHTQSSPSALWTVNHNLGYKPSAVRILSVGGLELIAAVLDISDDQLQVSFSTPTAGSAVIG